MLLRFDKCAARNARVRPNAKYSYLPERGAKPAQGRNEINGRGPLRGKNAFMSASPLNRRSAALYGAELTQPGYQQRIAESQNNEQHRSRKWSNGRSAYFHRTCLWFCHGPLPRLPGANTNPGAVSANMRGTHKETQTRFRMADAQIGASNPFTGFLGRQETCGRR